jgi:hypothetical protein
MTARRMLAAAVLASCLCAFTARADVAIEMRYPRELFRVASVTEFVTNDEVLRLEGAVISDGAPWTLTVSAPAGVPNLSAGSPAFSEATLDLTRTMMLTGVVFAPVIVREQGAFRSYGVREFLLSTSLDGGAYTAEVTLASGSGVGSPDGRATVSLGEPREARYVRLRWLSGWQRAAAGAFDVRLQRIHLATQESPLVAAPIVQFATAQAAPAEAVTFSYDVLLHEGRNRVSLQVIEDGPAGGDVGGSDSATIAATLLPELPTSVDADDGEATRLSDGASLTVSVPPGAAPETLRGISLARVPPEDVPPSSYRANAAIDSAYPPVLAYEFSGRLQEPFAAVSTASLPGQPPSLAVDGRFEFPSTWVTNLAPFPIRWRVDLRQESDVARVVVHPRVDEGVSFGPQRASVLFSRDNDAFVFAGELVEFPDGPATIEIENPGLARWVELVIDEGKQANNIQINEIEFFASSGARVLAQVEADTLSFREPVAVHARYFAQDLAAVGAPADAHVGAFMWSPSAGEWQWTRATHAAAHTLNPAARAGGGGLFAFDTNALSALAVFVLADERDSAEIVAAWTFNPFSPNGDGVADTTRLSIRLTGGAVGAESEISVRIYDTVGRLIATPADGFTSAATAIAIDWDGRDRNGRTVSIGAYVYEARVRRLDGSAPPLVANGLLAVAK